MLNKPNQANDPNFPKICRQQYQKKKEGKDKDIGSVLGNNKFHLAAKTRIYSQISCSASFYPLF